MMPMSSPTKPALTLLQVYTQLRGVYGKDIAQEAMLMTLVQAPSEPIARFRILARRLWRAHYHDGQISQAHQATRGREQVMGMHTDDDETPQRLWQHRTPQPPAIAEAREVLRTLPLWLLTLHLEHHVVKRARCPHPPQWWYPYQSSAGYAIRCRQCMAARTAARRVVLSI